MFADSRVSFELPVGFFARRLGQRPVVSARLASATTDVE
jgi:hypothetical protein